MQCWSHLIRELPDTALDQAVGVAYIHMPPARVEIEFVVH